MRPPLDTGLTRSAAALLTQSGLDATHVGDIGLAQADDARILRIARDEGYVVVTLDADFTAILALSRSSSPSVIRVRVEGLKGEKTAALLRGVVRQCAADLETGAVVTVEPARIGIRHLPLFPRR